MLFYQNEALIGLVFTSIPAILSLYFYFILERKGIGLVILLFTAFLIRILMISLDPYVHEWDERFHALVAKNMIDQPFKPMLFTKHILHYTLSDWGYNHIWVHKQPLFLWQMALSMKLFGINVIALRLPSAILGSIMVWLVYDMGKKWTANDPVAYISAFLSAFAYYALELISGWMSLDHNDLTFVFYMTCCYWCFTRYIHSGHAIRWAVVLGCFAGLAILNKWLVGLLIFGGWGLYILLSSDRFDVKKYLHVGIAAIMTCLVFVPWQLYILHAFPIESNIAFEYNRKHLTDDLGHPGGGGFHLKYLMTAYHPVLLGIMVLGFSSILYSKIADKKLTISFLSMIVVIFSFFSLFVATKMPAFVYPVSSLLYIFMGYGIYFLCNAISNYLNLIVTHKIRLLFIFSLIGGYYSFKPWLIAEQRSETNIARNTKIHNANVYKNIPDGISNSHVILNCRPYENIELMFYKNTLAYHWYPSPEALDSLQSLGYRFAAFDYTNDQQALPGYITTDPEVLILEGRPK